MDCDDVQRNNVEALAKLKLKVRDNEDGVQKDVEPITEDDEDAFDDNLNTSILMKQLSQDSDDDESDADYVDDNQPDVDEEWSEPSSPIEEVCAPTREFRYPSHVPSAGQHLKASEVDEDDIEMLVNGPVIDEDDEEDGEYMYTYQSDVEEEEECTPEVGDEHRSIRTKL